MLYSENRLWSGNSKEAKERSGPGEEGKKRLERCKCRGRGRGQVAEGLVGCVRPLASLLHEVEAPGRFEQRSALTWVIVMEMMLSGRLWICFESRAN